MNDTANRHIYIEPILKIASQKRLDQEYPDIDDFFSPKPKTNNEFAFDEIFVSDFLVILADPGEGKSRLLKEVVIRSKSFGKKAIFIDLKRLTNSNSISSSINDLVKRPQKPFASNKEINTIKDYFHSEKFSLDENSKDIIVCLDGLDEVRKDYVYDIIENIKQFKFSHPNVQVLISCREYIFDQKYEPSFNDLNPQTIRVKPFEVGDAKRYLKEYGFDENEINKVIERFYRNYKLEVINSPRILEIFADLKERDGLQATLAKSKANLIDHFIYAELEEEDKKLNSNHKEVVKRILEKLALTMEISQSNEISKDELMTFFDDVNSGLNAGFLQRFNISEFYDRALLIPSSTNNTLQFLNVEFQEYLAAKEISRLGKVEQAAFDLIVDKSVNVIIPSWANTLKYLFELVPEIQIPIIEFICRKENESDLALLDKILVSDTNIINALPKEVKDATFNVIFNKYRSRKWYLNFYLLEKLALYCSEELCLKLLELYVTKNNDEVTVENAISIAKYLLQTNRLFYKDEWKVIFVSKVKDTQQPESLRERSLMALAEYQDLSLLQSVVTIEEQSKKVKEAFSSACIKVAPNDPYTIELLISETNDYFAYKTSTRNDFDRISSPEGIKYLLKRMTDNDDSFNQRSLESYDIGKLERIAANIETSYDPDIKSYLTQLLVNAEYGLIQERFLSLLLEVIIRKETDYTFEFLEHIQAKYIEDWWTYNEIFKRIVTPSNAKEFIEKVLEINDSRARRGLVSLFTGFSGSEDPVKQELFELSKEYFKNDYLAQEKEHEEMRKNWDRTDSIYEDFKIRLEPTPDRFLIDLFRFYSANKDALTKRITDSDLSRMRKLILESVLWYDFSDAIVKRSETNGSTTIFERTQMIQIFGDVIPLLEEFNIDKALSRKRILQYFPFSFQNDDGKYLTEILGELTKEETDSLVQFYLNEREDDLYYVNIRNLFNACRRYKILDAIPILKDIVLNKRHENYTRKECLELINFLEPDIHFYKEVFDHYTKKRDKDSSPIVHLANEYLILTKNSYQEKAINWRIKKIASNPIPYTNDKDRINTHEIEYQSNQFNKPLLDISDIAFKDIYLSILDKAMKIYSKGEQYRSYAVYMWNITLVYYDNLKILKSFSPVQELERHILKFAKHESYDLLKSQFNRTRMSYVTELSKPASFSECIATYNALKSRKYLPISSSAEFYYLINDILENDIKRWVEEEGAYSFTKKFRDQEELIQKTIKTQLENGLLKRGLRESEVHIRREEQLLNNNRTDFVISYGFIGQVLIEIKLAKNKDVKSKTYPKKLSNYISGTKSDYGIFLIFQTDTAVVWKDIEQDIIARYEPMNEKIKVMGLNCILDGNAKT